MSYESLKNKVALVTGGSRGIGAAIAKRLAKEGVLVGITYLNNEAKAYDVVGEIKELGGTAFAIRADSGNRSQITNAVDEVAKTFGRFDILVNSAGVAVSGVVGDESVKQEELDRQYAINVDGVVSAVTAATKYLKEGGRIITIGSVVGETAGWPGQSHYGASKAAVAAYSRGWARDLGTKGITVNTVQPGPIDTDMNPADGELAKVITQSLAINRYGRADEIAAAVAFLASDDASYITGVSLNVDGGYRA